MSICKIFIKKVWGGPIFSHWHVVLRADTKIQCHRVLIMTNSKMRLPNEANEVNTIRNDGPWLHHNN